MQISYKCVRVVDKLRASILAFHDSRESSSNRKPQKEVGVGVVK